MFSYTDSSHPLIPTWLRIFYRPLARRRNNAEAPQELWSPPPYFAGETFKAKAIMLVRRVLDLQTATIWADLREALEHSRGRVLDVGCGAQPYRTFLPKAVAYSGIDTVKASNFGYVVPGVTYYQGDRWPVEDGAADVVLCTEVLEHVAEPGVFLSEAARSLQIGGKLVLTVPFAARWHYIPWDYWRFTPSSLGRLLREAGFADVKILARGNPLTVACYKAIGAMLPLVAPQGGTVQSRMLYRLLGAMLLLPLAALVALGHFSLVFDYGDDCLGYTVLAKRMD